jgi:hypothetical protein
MKADETVVRVRRGPHIVDDTLAIMGSWPVPRWRQASCPAPLAPTNPSHPTPPPATTPGHHPRPPGAPVTAKSRSVPRRR